MFDVKTIGSAFQDIYVFSKHFHVREDPRSISGHAEFFAFGTKIELDDIFFEVGGGATNAAFTLKRQGFRVGCVARIGNDGAGLDVRKCLRKEGIRDILIVDKKRRTGRGVVFLGRTGERTILVYRGAAQAYSKRELSPARISGTRWLYVTSLGGSLSNLEHIVTNAHKKSIRVCSNPGKQELTKRLAGLKKVCKRLDILSLNREEAATVTKRPYSNIKGMLSDLDKVVKGVVLITDGEHGSYAALNDERYRVILKPRMKVVDTVGAGDAFGSGFLSGYIRYRGDIKKSLTLATQNASSVIQQMGAKHGLLTRKSIKKDSTFTIKPYK